MHLQALFLFEQCLIGPVIVHLHLMDSTLKFAIVGCGKIAPRHAIEIIKHGELVAVCDIVKDKARGFSQKFNAKAYYSFDALLKNEQEVDIIVVCTPNGLHAEHSIQSLRAGKHVLCEKPMAISRIDGQRMIDVEQSTGKKLYVVKQNRYNPPVAFVKKMLEENKLGEILGFQLNCFWNRPAAYYADDPWKGTSKLDGGILYTQFSHFIDLLHWFLGDVKIVKGIRHNYLHKDCIEFEDFGVAFLQMENDAIGSVHYTINSNEKNMEGSLTLFGEKGTIKIGGQYLNELEYFSVPGENIPELPKNGPANEYGFYQGSMSNHDKVYENLMKALDDPSHPFIDAAEALKSVEIIEKIYEASPLLP